MADLYPGLKAGQAGAEAITVSKTAAAAIGLGALVIDSSPGTGEYEARVNNATATTATIRGVVVGGENRGVYGGTDENAASAAGQAVSVCIVGRCKVRVDGSTSAIAVGDALAPSTTARIAIKAGTGAFVAARALQASTAFGDYILCDVTREGIL